MAVASSLRDPAHLRALVDMGSNGIRFSISSLQPPTARILPTLYQHRVGISLYDAQHDAVTGANVPIGEGTISAVITAFRQFKLTCEDFGVKQESITVLATEATRTAQNSAEFRARIRDALGWEVEMLSKEDEGRVGAMGIASSLPEVSGLVMDLGGGSTQLSWLIKKGNAVTLPPTGAVSMPYGAAAMSQRLKDAKKTGQVNLLAEEVRVAVRKAFDSLNVPKELALEAESNHGFTLYLSGGGFRGWGYVLMSRHQIKPYPIPTINGFRVSRREFLGTGEVEAAAAHLLESSDEDGSIFRVSDRRASQVPAVAFLINALAEVLPLVKEVRFCQGGVREGYLSDQLDSTLRAQHPLVVATQPFDSPLSSESLASLLQSALPPSSARGPQDDERSIFTIEMLDTLCNIMYYHSSHSKDLQASAALRSTTSGILAGVHGVLHESRALIALLLCARWGGGVPPSDESFKRSLEQIVESPWTLWWINYIGAVSALIAAVYPAGIIRHSQQKRLGFEACWNTDEKQRRCLDLAVSLDSGLDIEAFEADICTIEKTGKRKRWIGGRDGVGHRVQLKVVRHS